VTQLRFDNSVTLLFDQGVEVRIEQPLVLHRDDGSQVHMDPEGDHGLLAPILELGRSVAQGGLAFDDGPLELIFARGSRLSVGASEAYEAWQISGPQGVLVASLPGGGLATWVGVQES
jgi:hypothetical protein